MYPSHVEISSHDDNNIILTSTPIKLATPVKVNHCYHCNLQRFSTKYKFNFKCHRQQPNSCRFKCTEEG